MLFLMKQNIDRKSVDIGLNPVKHEFEAVISKGPVCHRRGGSVSLQVSDFDLQAGFL